MQGEWHGEPCTLTMVKGRVTNIEAPELDSHDHPPCPTLGPLHRFVNFSLFLAAPFSFYLLDDLNGFAIVGLLVKKIKIEGGSPFPLEVEG